MLELSRPVDVRTLHFGPWGLGGATKAEWRQELLRREMDELLLNRVIPEAVRRPFENLKRLYIDGLFSYENFTSAEREAYRVLEVALKVRFLSFYSDGVPLVSPRGLEIVKASKFDDVRRGLLGAGCRLQGHRRFDGSLRSLLGWARREGLLFGQFNRVREGATVELRNSLVHSEHDTVLMPPDAVRTIGLHFQWIQRLWGFDTQEGQAYPGPVLRTPWVVGFGPGDGDATWFPLDLPEAEDCAGRYHVVLAVAGERLSEWREGFETTPTPVEGLWGPGSWQDLQSAAADAARLWPPDTVTLLDRLFFIRATAAGLDLPRSSAQVLALRGSDPAERWSVVRADAPGWALAHVREAEHRIQGPCRCPVDTVMSGARRETVVRLAREVTGGASRAWRASRQSTVF